MQVHSSRNYIPVVKSPSKHTSLPSIVAIFLAIYLMAVLQLSGYSVTNFIQLVSPQPVDQFSQTKLCWKAPNEGYPHIYGMYKSNNK